MIKTFVLQSWRSIRKANTLVKGALILTVAGIISKILGAIYRIPLGQIITSEGLVYHQTAMIYILMLTFLPIQYRLPYQNWFRKLEEGRKMKHIKYLKLLCGFRHHWSYIIDYSIFECRYFSQALKIQVPSGGFGSFTAIFTVQ